MSQQPKDAAQTLAEMLALGQERLRQLTTGPFNGAHQAENGLEMMKRYASMQQDLANEVTRFWSSMSSLAGFPARMPTGQPDDEQQFSHFYRPPRWAPRLSALSRPARS